MDWNPVWLGLILTWLGFFKNRNRRDKCPHSLLLWPWMMEMRRRMTRVTGMMTTCDRSDHAALSVNSWLVICIMINCLSWISSRLLQNDSLRISGSFLADRSKIPMVKFPSFSFRKKCIKSYTAAYPHTVKLGTEFANQNHTGSLGCITSESPWPHYFFSHLERIPVKDDREVFAHVLHLTQRWDDLHLAVGKGLRKSGNSYLEFLSWANNRSSIY